MRQTGIATVFKSLAWLEALLIILLPLNAGGDSDAAGDAMAQAFAIIDAVVLALVLAVLVGLFAWLRSGRVRLALTVVLGLMALGTVLLLMVL